MNRPVSGQLRSKATSLYIVDTQRMLLGMLLSQLIERLFSTFSAGRAQTAYLWYIQLHDRCGVPMLAPTLAAARRPEVQAAVAETVARLCGLSRCRK